MNSMNHDTFRELLALRRYGELSETERRALESHLEGCEACRSFGREFEATFGALEELERAQPYEGAPPAWLERLNAQVRAQPRSRRFSPPSFAVGLAAGLLLMSGVAAFLRTGASSGSRADATVISNAGTRTEFAARLDPPPRTSSRGLIAHVATLRRQ